MKLQFQALSITLGLVALLGTCMSAKSGTPDVNSVDSHVENSAEVVPNEIQLGDAEDAKVQAAEEIQDAKVEVSEDTEVQANEEMPDSEDTEVQATEEMPDAEAQATEEIKDAEAAEIQTPELETVQESESVEESGSTEETVENRVETVKKDGAEAVEDVKSKF
jgi:hypothetical protein